MRTKILVGTLASLLAIVVGTNQASAKPCPPPIRPPETLPHATTTTTQAPTSTTAPTTTAPSDSTTSLAAVTTTAPSTVRVEIGTALVLYATPATPVVASPTFTG